MAKFKERPKPSPEELAEREAERAYADACKKQPKT